MAEDAPFGSFAPYQSPPLDMAALLQHLLPNLRMLASTPQSGGAVNAGPQSGFSGVAMPNVNASINSGYPVSGGPSSAPIFSGSINAPMFGGEVSGAGSYYRPHPLAPPHWSTSLRYQKQF